MAAPVVLGLSATERQLVYAVHRGDDAPGELAAIGRIQLNVDVEAAIMRRDPESYKWVVAAVDRLLTEHQATRIRIVVPARSECWASVTKLVHDQIEERDAVIGTLMAGLPRKQIQVVWHDMAQRDHRMLVLRDRSLIEGYRQLAELAPESEWCSEFEAVGGWVARTGIKSGVLAIGCHESHLVVTSHTLGKLRGATWFGYEDPTDLPYLWTEAAGTTGWMAGVHDRIVLYGNHSWHLVNRLRPVLDRKADLMRLEELHIMEVASPETTFNFPLDEAFTAVQLAVGG